MNRPKDSEKCGNEQCKHSFGQHFTTYDRKKNGCSFFQDDQRSPGICFCKGFALVQAWEPSKPERPLPPDSGQMYR